MAATTDRRSREPPAQAGAAGDERLSTAAAATYLGISDSTVRRMIGAGKLMDHPRRRDLDAYLATARVEPGSLGHLCMWDRPSGTRGS